MHSPATRYICRHGALTVSALAVIAFWGSALSASGQILLNELKVNPPGKDEPYEYIELRGTPGAAYSNLYLLVVEGDGNADPGRLDLLFDLSGIALGTNGYLVLVGQGHPYVLPADTTVITNAAFGQAGGALENGAISFLLATCPTPPVVGDDLDHGDNGTLELLPDGTVILDAVGWTDGSGGDEVYGGAELDQPDSTPDAAGRYPGNDFPAEADAWFNADLVDSSGAELRYGTPAGDPFPWGTVMTPGGPNYIAPVVSGPDALSGVVGDPTNPGIDFTVDLSGSEAGPISASAHSDNPGVVPDSNLTATVTGPGTFHLDLDPVGVGYATVTVYAGNGYTTGRWEVTYAASVPERPGGRFLTGVSDGSAAIPVDANWMLVADDEDQIIRMYPRHLSGAPVAAFDIGPELNLTDDEDGVPREVDFEGVTRDGDMIYWLGSHSHAEIGELRPNRWRVAATRLSGAGPSATLAYIGHYEHLRDDLLVWDQSNGHGKGTNYYGLVDSAANGVIPKEPNGAGFNLEGLAMAPGQPDTAYLCFRAPLTPVDSRARALIVPVTNLAAMAVAGDVPGQAAFGEPIELFLGGRGIRAIEGGPQGFLITAGSVDNRPAIDPTLFKLYTWTGLPGDSPIERSTDLSFLNPESIVELPPLPWTPTTRVQVISDTGRTVYYGDGIAAKLLPEPAFRKFRSDWIELGVPVDPQPRIHSFAYSETLRELTWFAQTGRTYQIQATPLLDTSAWTNLTTQILADLPLMLHPLPPLATRTTSFRVTLLP